MVERPLLFWLLVGSGSGLIIAAYILYLVVNKDAKIDEARSGKLTGFLLIAAVTAIISGVILGGYRP